jgi:yecA family protein
MNTVRRLDFDEVCDLFVAVEAHNSPAEMHGLLTGQLAAGKRMSQPEWLQEAREFLDTDHVFNPDESEQLFYVYLSTLAALGDENLGFYPLLPNDDDDMEERLTSLGLWCQGFLAGFALVEKAITQLSEPVNDALNDLAAIAQVGLNDEEEWDESAEEDYIQIIEYVRLAVMNIFLEYAVNDKPEAEAETLSAQNLFNARKVH